MRTFLAYFNLVNFVVMIFVTVYVLSSFWGQLQDFWLVLYVYYVILGCSGAAVSVWIGIDGNRLDRYSKRVRSLEKKLNELEKKVRLINPSNE